MKPDITTKQMGDAGEALVVSELTLAGVPAVKMPDNWPNYDVIAEPEGAEHPQRISVKTRTFKRGGDAWIEYNINDCFDWMAIVILPNDKGEPDKRRVFIFPKTFSDDKFYRSKPGKKSHDNRDVQIDRIDKVLLEYEDNFSLSQTGKSKSS
ncbi:MAG TPA: hypothetical protein VGE85_01125 [Terracidiphilus sp.]|jgi:hypothetical protein